MPSGTHPLTYPERCPIYALRKSGYSIRAIAQELGRSHTTLSRELRRNCGDRGYRHKPAERTARERRGVQTAGRDSGCDRGRGCSPNRVDSAARPARVEAKTRVGDWEADTGDVQGARGVDRMSKRVLIQRVPRKTAAAVGDAIRTMRTPDPVHTITADPGSR